jgi:hypothetical protein
MAISLALCRRTVCASVLALFAWIGLQPDFTATNSVPWSAILDPNIATVQNLFGYRLSLADYAARRWMRTLRCG